MWVDPRDWIHEGNPEYIGRRDVDVKIIDGTSSEILHNSTNLVSHWKFDESSGTTYDSVTGATGSLKGNASYTTGKFGNAVQLDGVNDYISSSQNLAAVSLSETTISVWVRFGDFPSNNYGTIINPNYDGWLWLQVDNSTGTPVASFGGYGSNGGVVKVILSPASTNTRSDSPFASISTSPVVVGNIRSMIIVIRLDLNFTILTGDFSGYSSSQFLGP